MSPGISGGKEVIKYADTRNRGRVLGAPNENIVQNHLNIAFSI